MLDKMMITCSFVELTTLSSFWGLGHLTVFQWVMAALLMLKLAAMTLAWRRQRNK